MFHFVEDVCVGVEYIGVPPEGHAVIIGGAMQDDEHDYPRKGTNECTYEGAYVFIDI